MTVTRIVIILIIINYIGRILIGQVNTHYINYLIKLIS